MAYKIICPKCKSDDISPNPSTHSFIIGTFQHEHKCNKCGYEGIFPEIRTRK